MWKRIRDFFTPPSFDDPEQTRRTATLYRALVGTLIVTGAHTLVTPAILPNSDWPFLIGLMVSVLVILSMWLVRTGRHTLAMTLVTSMFWIVITLASILIHGLDTPILSAYVAAAVLVGYFAGIRALVGYSIVTSLFLLGSIWADANALLPEPSGGDSPYANWWIVTSGLVMTTVLISLSRRNNDLALDEALQSQRAAVEATHQLEASGALLATRAREQATTAELGQLALAEASLDVLIAEASKAVAATLEMDLVTVLECTPGGDAFRLRAGLGWAEESAGSALIPAEHAVTAAHTLSSNEPVIVEDWSMDERFPQSPGLRELGVMSSISVGIRGTDEPYGVFAAHSKKPRKFTEDDVRFLQSVANLLALVRRREETVAALQKSEANLLHARKMEAIGQFAGGIAHDFNNMLTAISGYNQMIMQRMAPDDPGLGDARQVKHASERAAALTQQILAFSRRQILQPEVLDLNAIIRKTRGMLERIIGEDVTLSISLEPELLLVRADPSQVEQVLVNLAANARDAMPRGGYLEIETRNVDPKGGGPGVPEQLAPGPCVRISIADTGSGMASATREQIFEPFFTTKNPTEGTGLGLATVYGIVKQSGGEIEVETEEGSFTRFFIYLPASDDAREPSLRQEEPKLRPHGHETVLLAEDEPTVRRLTRRMLEELGYAVLEAENGARALSVASRHEGPIELLVTDVVMPEMGGAELADRLESVRPETRVVYVSGYAADVLDQERFEKGSAVFLAKPFSHDELARKLRELLD
jgi:signal transduction histidine kinase